MYASNFKAQLNQTKKVSKADRAFWRFSSDIMRVAAYGAEGTTTQSVSDNIREGTKRKKRKAEKRRMHFSLGGYHEHNVVAVLRKSKRNHILFGGLPLN